MNDINVIEADVRKSKKPTWNARQGLERSRKSYVYFEMVQVVNESATEE